ncbi:hypothetical protein D3C76_1293340 [compost metagenome]
MRLPIACRHAFALQPPCAQNAVCRQPARGLPTGLQLGTDPVVEVLHQLIMIVLQRHQGLERWTRALLQTRLLGIQRLLIQARIE